MYLLPWMEQWNMLPEEGGTILCAVSGGRDSICLLHYLYTLSKDRPFRVAVAHLNHMMRSTAERDESFVRSFCEERNIPFYTEKGDVYGKAKEWNVTVEESGRKLRYDFFERTAKEIGATKIATAHHQLDQAETVILNLLRGTGPDGLSGIPPVRGPYIRPLLQTGRDEIEAYIEGNHLAYVEDETNTNLDFARNKLRLQIWPELQSINPSLQDNICKASGIVRSENQYLDALALSYLPQEGTEVDVETCLRAGDVLTRRMIRLLMKRLPSGKKDVGSVHVDAILSLLKSGGTLSLPGNMEAICRDGKLRLQMLEKCNQPRVLHQGENRWGDYCITLEKEPTAPLYVRAWTGEDRLFLEGSNGERSLKRLFVDKAILPEQRNAIPVIAADDHAIYAETIGADQRYQEILNNLNIIIAKEN